MQEKLVLKDFNIEDEAGRTGKPIVKTFTTNITSNTLKIHFYWAGRGTTGIPLRGVYGPSISAISVQSSKSIYFFDNYFESLYLIKLVTFFLLRPIG